MKFPSWLRDLALVVLGALGALLTILGLGRKSPTPADAIVASADAEKAKADAAVEAESDQAVTAAFNAEVKKEGGPT
jgi:hypothetical protein